jgi:hypothetical protein
VASDKDVFAEPLIRLRAESASLKADLDKAKAVLKAATTDMERETARALVQGLEKKLSGVGAALTKTQKAAAKEAKQIQAHLDRLNATKATASMALLEKAVTKAGGVSKLSGDQIGILTKQIERLNAAGAKTPKTLVLPKAPGGLGAGFGVGLQSAAAGLAPAGALGAGLTAIGPAGLAAAAGIGAFTLAAKAGFDAISNLAGEAERWTNVASGTGLGVKEVQQLEAFLEDAGFQAGDLERIMRRLALSIVNGDDALAKFGIDVRELKGLAPEEQLRELSRQVTSIIDPTERAAAELAAFGRAGQKVDAALRGIAAGGFKEMQVLNQQTIDDLVKIDAELDAAGRAWTDWKNTALAAMLRVAKQINDQAQPGNLFRLTPAQAPDLPAATPEERESGERAKRAQEEARKAAVLAADAERKARAAALAKEKKDAAEAPARAAKAQREAQREAEAYRRELERISAEERKGELDAVQRWQKEEDAVVKTNTAVKKHLSDVEVSIFGTSKDAALEASIQFDALQTVISRTGKSIQTMTESDLKAYEAQLVRMEKATRADAEANDEVATTLGNVRAQLRELNGEQGFEGIKAPVEEVKTKTIEWHQQLQSISALIQSFPGGLGKVGDALSGLTAGGAGIGAGLDAFKKAGAAGGLSGFLGQAGAVGQIASAAIGIGSAIVGLFKSDPVKKAQKAAGQALGYEISRELAETLLAEAKRSGQSIEAVAKQYKRRVLAEQASANREQLEAGVNAARQGAEELSGLLDKFGPKAQAAGGALVAAVAAAMAANGLGVLDPALAKNEQFSAVQSAVGAAGQITQGLRQAGGIDTDFLLNGGAFADALREEAVAAALAEGKTQAEADKAGLAVIAPLLRDQLNASLESGQKLSGQTQALLDEAKANGIEIVADPMIALLDESKEQTGLLHKIAFGFFAGDKGDESIDSRAGGRQTFSAAGGLDLLTGPRSPRLDLQLHANERLRVTPGVSSASLVGGSSSGGPGGGGASVTFSPNITINAAPNWTGAQFEASVTAAMTNAVKQGSPELTRALGRKYSRP